MFIREIITEVVDPQTGEITEVSNFQNGLLYGLYAVVSNKTVRAKERLMIRWKNRNSSVPGNEMIKTNRGWFLDGYQLDEKSTELWFTATKNHRSWRPKENKKWNSQKKPGKKS